MTGFVQDLQFAVRYLMRNKRTTLLAILVLGLGIGMTSGTFSGANPWLYRELPWGDGHELVHVSEEQSLQPSGQPGTSGPSYLDWRRKNRVFKAMAAFRRTDASISTNNEPWRFVFLDKIREQLATPCVVAVFCGFNIAPVDVAAIQSGVCVDATLKNV